MCCTYVLPIHRKRKNVNAHQQQSGKREREGTQHIERLSKNSFLIV